MDSNLDFGRRRKKSNSEAANKEQETIDYHYSFCSRNLVIKAILAVLLMTAISFIALPVLALFIKSPLDTTLRSLHDPVVIDALRLSLITSAITTPRGCGDGNTHCLCQCSISLSW